MRALLAERSKALSLISHAWGEQTIMDGIDIDMRTFARNAGANVSYAAGSIVFNKGDPGTCMYVVQSGVLEMVIGEKVVEVCGANEAIGFMSVIDNAPRSSTARVKEACELSVIDERRFRLHGGRGAELRALHHGRHGPPHPRHGSGDVALLLAASRFAVRAEPGESHPGGRAARSARIHPRPIYPVLPIGRCRGTWVPALAPEGARPG
jgi:CRP/FNR family transcriptional regulator